MSSPSREDGTGKAATPHKVVTDLPRVHGIALDKRAERFLIVSFGGDTIFAWKPGSGNLETLAAGPGQFDGIEITDEGRVFITSQSTGSLWELRGDQLLEWIVNLPGAADLGTMRRDDGSSCL